MKDYKTINKRPDINKYPIEKMDIAIKGKILYVVSSESHSTFVLTEDGYFYVITKGKSKDIQGFELKSDLLDPVKVEKMGAKFQTDKKESQIWCDKFGTHVIIKYKNVSFYYNPLMAKKLEELNLNMFGNTFLQPYAVAFNDDVYDCEDTGKILFSDYNSVIYELQLKLSEEKEMIRLSFGKVFSFKIERPENEKENDEDVDFEFFKMDDNDRILDMKLIVLENPTIGVSKADNEDRTIFILAITKHILFQFIGQKSFKDVFENYTLEDGKILKAYKKFISPTKIDDKYSRIQLLHEEASAEVLFGFMTQCGYIMGKFENTINLTPQKNFSVIKYYKPSKETEEKNLSSHNPIPKTVCQSKNHIFFLYRDCLVIQNKLTKRIIHDEYLPYSFSDMYYSQILNGIILYNEKGIYKIPLELEFRYLFEDYIEIGNFETALALLTKDDKNIKPKLHKIYADNLFEKKNYLEAAKEYAFSDEIFEHVCMKFLNINNNLALIRYLALVNNLRIKQKSNINNEKEENNKDSSFIEKYLIDTWLLELLFGKDENIKSKELSPDIRAFIRNEREYLDLNLLYFVLNIYGKENELLELASSKQDYETIILYLINKKKISESINYIQEFLNFGIEDVTNLLKKLFFDYANLFIKEYPKETINLLKEHFKLGYNPEDIIKILISPNFHILAGNSESFKIIIEYIKLLKLKPIKDGDSELNLTKDQNLHNLYVLLSSYSKQETYKNELIDYLKNPIEYFEINKKYQKGIDISESIYFDLYFAKKIFEKKNEEKDIKVLCLILFLLKQYPESIDIALNYKFSDLITLLPKNIPDPKLKKKIWLQIFENKRKSGNLAEAKNVVTESKGIIKIEDILPLMGDDVKISEFKQELKDCISSYEQSVQLLRKEIKEFNDSNDLINKDIDFSEKKAIKMNYTRLRCYRCGKNISGLKFFMFPCKHMFDVECLIDTYKEFNKHNLGDQNFKNKVKVITELYRKIKHLKNRKQKSLEEEQKSKEIENLGTLQKLKTLNIKTLLSKDIKVQFSSEEELMLKDTQKMLYDYLDDECLLCGKEMVDSTQVDFGDEDDISWEVI